MPRKPPAINALEQLWNSFEQKTNDILEINHEHFPDIKKLMTAESVIDVSSHDIYFHTGYVHELSKKLLHLKNEHLEDKLITECCQLWLEILKQRNKIPLKIKHHKRLDGECNFKFSLQLMEGKPNGFKEIQVLNPKNNAELKAAIKAIHQLDCLSFGFSFADLPLMHDDLLSTLMEYKDVICLLAKDQQDQIIGHCWGIVLRDIPVSETEKVNVFYVMTLARHPDFPDENTKVGEKLRAAMVDMIKSRNDCAFVGYQHILNHQFHMGIIGDTQNDKERIHFNNEEFSGKTNIKYDDSMNLFMRTHFIKTGENNYAYPGDESIKPALFQAFWRAAHSTKDFVLGAITFFGRAKYQKLTHHTLNDPIDQRLIEPVSNEQQACDIKILREIILSELWTSQGKSIFHGKHTPNTVSKLQKLAQENGVDFLTIKSYITNSGKNLARSKVTTLFYNVISIAESPTETLNSLLKKCDCPKEWVNIISHHRSISDASYRRAH